MSLAFKVGVDDPRRFSRSRDVGAHFGLTPREYSSGEVSYRGRISKMGDREVRRLLYLAAARILRRDAALWCPLKVWAVRLAQRVGLSKARVQVVPSAGSPAAADRSWRDRQPAARASTPGNHGSRRSLVYNLNLADKFVAAGAALAGGRSASLSRCEVHRTTVQSPSPLPSTAGRPAAARRGR